MSSLLLNHFFQANSDLELIEPHPPDDDQVVPCNDKGIPKEETPPPGSDDQVVPCNDGEAPKEETPPPEPKEVKEPCPPALPPELNVEEPCLTSHCGVWPFELHNLVPSGDITDTDPELPDPDLQSLYFEPVEETGKYPDLENLYFEPVEETRKY